MAVNKMQISAITITLSFIKITAAHRNGDCQYKYVLSLPLQAMELLLS